MNRNASLDVYRCFLMFGICLLHAIAQGERNVAWAANCLSWCVPAFVFISGWYGIRFSFLKLLKLYGISFYCAAIFVGVDMLICTGGGEGCVVFRRIWAIATGQWFLNAYAVLMCFAPMLNKAVEYSTKEFWNVFGPFLFVAFGWSFATTLPVLPRWVPQTPGLTSYSFLTLLGVYAVARFMRVADFKLPKLPRFVWMIVVGVCLVLSSIGFNDYNSPVAICIATLTFVWFKGLKMPEWLGRVCVWLGPSMFSIYLLHSHTASFAYMQKLEDCLLGANLPLALMYAVTAVVVFLLCVVADLPRRLIRFR